MQPIGMIDKAIELMERGLILADFFNFGVIRTEVVHDRPGSYPAFGAVDMSVKVLGTIQVSVQPI